MLLCEFDEVCYIGMVGFLIICVFCFLCLCLSALEVSMSAFAMWHSMTSAHFMWRLTSAPRGISPLAMIWDHFANERSIHAESPLYIQTYNIRLGVPFIGIYRGQLPGCFVVVTLLERSHYARLGRKVFRYICADILEFPTIFSTEI